MLKQNKYQIQLEFRRIENFSLLSRQIIVSVSVSLPLSLSNLNSSFTNELIGISKS